MERYADKMDFHVRILSRTATCNTHKPASENALKKPTYFLGFNRFAVPDKYGREFVIVIALTFRFAASNMANSIASLCHKRK